MSRFLARALATVRAEVAPVARPAPLPKPPEPDFGDFGGLGERAENENSPPPASPPARFNWPERVDYWLTHDAAKRAVILNGGGTYRWCPTGGLDVWREDDRYVGFSRHKTEALRAAGLLPEALEYGVYPFKAGS